MSTVAGRHSLTATMHVATACWVEQRIWVFWNCRCLLYTVRSRDRGLRNEIKVRSCCGGRRLLIHPTRPAHLQASIPIGTTTRRPGSPGDSG